ncbi:unnamed protein product, partial [Iphiclides podalirius]
MASLTSPVPITEIESVLAWVDGYKLSRPTKKINRDFSDAVLLAEILSVHYPKLVEMHNYPPRNSHSLKLNNWLTLNRKVLKRLKLNLCSSTMEQLAHNAPGVIERVLIMGKIEDPLFSAWFSE